MSKAFIRWVGGKTRLATDIAALAPANFNRYHEPFLGSGAVHFALAPEQAVLSDANEEIFTTFVAVRDHLDDLIAYLSKQRISEACYLRHRNLDRTEATAEASLAKLSLVERAARFILINRMGFNGLYRVNQSGFCNTPYGKISGDRDLVRADLLTRASEILQTADLHQRDYLESLDAAEAGDFVYLDPPYLPQDDNGKCFTAYTADGFGMQDYEALALKLDELTERGVCWLLSNHLSDYIWLRFKGYHLRTIDTRRSVGATSSSRGLARELLVSNYPL